MNKHSLQERLLLFKVRYNQDPEAFGALYDLYVERIYRFIRFKVATDEDAEDIAAEVFLKTWQYIKTSDKKIENFSALLYRMARNAVIDYYRNKRRTEEHLTDEDHFNTIMDSRNVATEVEQKIEIEKIEKHLNFLKDEYRDAIILKYVEGFSINEIAHILKKSSSNVRVLLHRGMKRLREIIGNKL